MSKHAFRLSDKQLEALQRIFYQWISEGFTDAPYSDEQYDLFELFKLDPKSTMGFGYDIRRPRRFNWSPRDED